MPKYKHDTDEPLGRKFYPLGDLYCSYCREFIEPEFWDENPCHLCGEFSWLYEKKP